MSTLLDLATIKFNYKWGKTLLAKVTLNFQDEFEIRFCRLTLTKTNQLWFQPPALKEAGWAKCFAILDTETYHEFSKKVIDQFYKEVEIISQNGEVPEYYLDLLKKIKTEEINLDDIPL